MPISLPGYVEYHTSSSQPQTHEYKAKQIVRDREVHSAQCVEKYHNKPSTTITTTQNAQTNEEGKKKPISIYTEERELRTSLFIVKMALNFHIWHNNFAWYMHSVCE